MIRLSLSDYFTQGEKWLHEIFSAHKQFELPAGFRVFVDYDHDVFQNSESPGVALTKLQETLTLLDFPNFFVTIRTSYSEIQRDLAHLQETICPFDSAMTVELSETNFHKELEQRDSLCLYPWLHLYVNPQGLVGPCCVFDEKYPIGNISDGLENLVNNENLKTIRKQMINGQRPNACATCWKKEDNGLVSLRAEANTKWNQYSNLVGQTKSDGEFSEFKLRFLDFRASNICNLKCVMCSGKFSSKIAQEDSELYGNRKHIDLSLSDTDISTTLNYIEDNILNIEEVYFAGGEPLITKEHYDILDLFIKHNKTDIRIFYNTNLTVLRFKSVNVVDYWSKFKNITVRASIDAIGPQAEYVRYGTNYAKLESNYLAVKDHVAFKMVSVAHLLNIFNLPKLQRHWIIEFGLSAKDVAVDTLVNPSFMSLQVLPEDFKKQATQSILAHKDWLRTVPDSEKLLSDWEAIEKFMWFDDQSHLIGEFFRVNDAKDK